MDNKTTVKERLLHYLEEKNLTQAEFARRIDRSKAYVSQLSPNGFDFTDLEKIEAQFPDLNTDWLLTGEGQMLNVPETSREPALRCTTVFGNEVLLKLRNIEEMTYNPAAKIVQIFTHHQHLIVPMGRDEFEKLYQTTITLKLTENK